MFRLLTSSALIATAAAIIAWTPKAAATAQYGAVRYGSETLPSLSVCGALSLDGTHITENLQVKGSLTSKDAQINRLDVSGSVLMRDSVVLKDLNVNGSVQLLNSQVDGTLTASTNVIVLDRSTASTIIVKGAKENQKPQVIRLVNKTKVHGNITFEAGNGQVVLDEDAEVTGQVIGGSLKAT